MTTSAAVESALLDTNVLVYALDQESPFHSAARTLLLRAADTAWQERLCVTPQVLAEFFAVVTNPRRVRSPRSPEEALRALEQFIALPNLTVLAVPVDVVSRWVPLVRAHRLGASRVFDAQLAATIVANGVRRIYTFDRAHFECFAELEVITPQQAIASHDNPPP